MLNRLADMIEAEDFILGDALDIIDKAMDIVGPETADSVARHASMADQAATAKALGYHDVEAIEPRKAAVLGAIMWISEHKKKWQAEGAMTGIDRIQAMGTIMLMKYLILSLKKDEHVSTL